LTRRRLDSMWCCPPTSAPGLGSPLPHPHRDWAHPLPHLHRGWAHPLPHLRRDWAHPYDICAGTELAPATSALGLCSPAPHLCRDWIHPLPHLHWDWAHPATSALGPGPPGHICAGTGLTPATSASGLSSSPATSAPGLGSPLPHLRWDWAGRRCRSTPSFSTLSPISAALWQCCPRRRRAGHGHICARTGLARPTSAPGLGLAAATSRRAFERPGGDGPACP
jgi:hypothetical protein